MSNATRAWINEYERKQAEETAARIQSDEHAYVKDGVRHWRANDAVIPPHVYKDANLACPEIQRLGYEKSLDAFAAQYRKDMANHVPSAEERYEMRAAFGPGETVVDVLTGKRYRT